MKRTPLIRLAAGTLLRAAALSGALLLSSLTARAQDTLRLSLDSAITIALQNSKTLLIARQQSEAAQAAAQAAQTTMLPTLKAGASYARLSDVPAFAVTTPFPAPLDKITLSDPILDNYSAKLALEQPLFTGGKLKAAVDAQRAAAGVAGADLQTTRSQLIYDAQKAYWQLYKATEFKSVIDDNLATVEAHLKDVRNLVEQGLATTTDALAVEVQLADVRLTQIDATDNVRLAAIALCNQVGLPLNTPINVSTRPDRADDIEIPVRFRDGAALDQTALARRAELNAAQHRIEAGSAGVRLARAGWLPQFAGVANFSYQNPNQRYQPLTHEWNDSWDVGIAATWTLWNWGATKHQTRLARAQLAQAETARAAMQDAIRLEVTADLLHLNEARQKISVAADGARLAEENYRATREKFKNGLARNSELLDAEDDLLRARWNQTQSIVDFQVAIARLDKSTAATR
ncbi:TolC family protein [candidate division KSB1 bacterium]|nr:TolC family protein [candidate division KSB1 bacterium]